jgi:hypothetical protein
MHSLFHKNTVFFIEVLLYFIKITGRSKRDGGLYFWIFFEKSAVLRG